MDNAKIRDLVQSFMNLILHGTTTLENISHIISHMYRTTIRQPALALGQWLPDWPPKVVQRHIENMTEPRVVNALLLRRHLKLIHDLTDYSMEYNPETGRREPNLPVVRALYQGMRELRELYRQVPKESFGYNESLRAESWAGGVLVHPARIQGPGTSGSFAGAPVATRPGRAGARKRAVVEGEDTGHLRGPANNEDLARRV